MSTSDWGWAGGFLALFLGRNIVFAWPSFSGRVVKNEVKVSFEAPHDLQSRKKGRYPLSSAKSFTWVASPFLPLLPTSMLCIGFPKRKGNLFWSQSAKEPLGRRPCHEQTAFGRAGVLPYWFVLRVLRERNLNSTEQAPTWSSAAPNIFGGKSEAPPRELLASLHTKKGIRMEVRLFSMQAIVACCAPGRGLLAACHLPLTQSTFSSTY